MEQNNFVSVGDKMLYQRGPNPNLRGMKTQFGNDFNISNKIINNGNDVFNKYDVIPNSGLNYNLVNRPHKLVVHFDQTDDVAPLILNESFQDVVSVKLLNGIFMEAAEADSDDDGVESYAAPLFITLSISELNNIYGTTTTPGTGNTLLDSFATLEYDKTVDRDTTNAGPASGNPSGIGRVNIYKNKFGINGDIKYFDPPLNSLSQLNIKAYDDSSNTESVTYKCKLEFMIETKEKMRLY
tara:strand:- start:5620 stop:6339 length:720 start_codon:yes stop_codon:yes gene_type:complete